LKQVVFDLEQILHLGSTQSLGGNLVEADEVSGALSLVGGALAMDSDCLRESLWLFSVADKSLKELCDSLKLVGGWFLMKSSVAFQFWNLIANSARVG
jgi:hypothetical protein